MVVCGKLANKSYIFTQTSHHIKAQIIYNFIYTNYNLYNLHQF